MLPKKGRRVPAWKGVLFGREIYAQTIADLLRKEHGDSRRAIKHLMRQTDASERAVKHWLSGKNGPETVFFLRLLVSSPVIRAFVLGLLEGPASQKWTAQLDRFSLAAAREAYAAGENTSGSQATDYSKYDPKDDPNDVPNGDPETIELNERQHWFLALIAEGLRCSAKDIMAMWRVSLKTARRDISGLQQARLLEFTGPRRKGQYRQVGRERR